MLSRIGLLVFLAVVLFTLGCVSKGLAQEPLPRRGPSTRHLQILCLSDGLLQFEISSKGTLSPITYSFADTLPLPQTDHINELVPDPVDHSIYALWLLMYNQGSATSPEIDRMQISNRGRLASVLNQAFPLNNSQTGPRSMVILRQGKFIVVVFDRGQNSKTFLRTYRVQPGGSLCPTSKPFTLHNSFQSIAVDSTGRSVYIIDTKDSHIYQYSISATGIFAPLAVPVLSTIKQPAAITFHPSRHFAYVTTQGESSVTLYREDSEGCLSFAAKYPLDNSKLAPSVAITPSGRFLYASSPTGGTFQYHILTDGRLQSLTPKTIHSGGYKMLVDFTCRFVYSLSNTSGNNVIYQYRIQRNGTLMPLVPRIVSHIGTPVSMAIVEN